MSRRKSARLAVNAKPLRLTAGREQVLGILRAHAKPLGAYDIIQAIQRGTGKEVAPVTIYRALHFLLDNGLAHRLATQNAYVACALDHEHNATCPSRPHGAALAFLICEDCDYVGEIDSEPLRETLAALARRTGFAPKSEVIEITGLCAVCTEKHDAERCAKAMETPAPLR